MSERDDESDRRLRLNITAMTRAESIMLNYISDPSRNTRQMIMDACMAHYYPRAVMSDSNYPDEGIVSAAIDSIAEHRNWIDKTIMDVESRDIDLPISIYGSDTPIKPTKAKSEKKPAKPKSPPKPKVEEDDDEDWAEDDPRWGSDDDEHFIKLPPPMIIDLTD